MIIWFGMKIMECLILKVNPSVDNHIAVTNRCNSSGDIYTYLFFTGAVTVSLAHCTSSGVLSGVLTGHFVSFSHLSVDSQLILLPLLYFFWSCPPAELGAKAHPLMWWWEHDLNHNNMQVQQDHLSGTILILSELPAKQLSLQLSSLNFILSYI